MNPKITGSFIASLRKEAGLTQKQLADKLQVSDKAVSRWETGKGYPDIESLMSLSKLFSVSINELLSGKRHETTATAKLAEREIAIAYIQTAEKKKKISRISIVLCSIYVIIIAVMVGSFLISKFSAFHNHVIGTPNCVIAEDYSSIMIFGERYVPLQLDGVLCSQSELLIEEAQVENSRFWGKLFFGEMIYSVRNCPNNDIIYLQSEYDDLVSEYYCKESMVEHYKALSQKSDYDSFFADIRTEYFTVWDLTLEPELVQLLQQKDYVITSDADNTITYEDHHILIHCKLPGTPFIRYKGYFLRRNNEYYWIAWDDPSTYGLGGKAEAFAIDKHYYDVLNTLFSYQQ